MLLRIYQVILSSKIEDWELLVHHGRLDHKEVRTLHITINETSKTKDVHWNDTFYGEDSKSSEVEIHYAGECIARYPFSVLSNNQLMLPMPRTGSNKISDKQMSLSKIINAKEDILEYLKAYNIEVCESVFT